MGMRRRVRMPLRVGRNSFRIYPWQELLPIMRDCNVCSVRPQFIKNAGKVLLEFAHVSKAHWGLQNWYLIFFFFHLSSRHRMQTYMHIVCNSYVAAHWYAVSSYSPAIPIPNSKGPFYGNNINKRPPPPPKQPFYWFSKRIVRVQYK